MNIERFQLNVFVMRHSRNEFQKITFPDIQLGIHYLEKNCLFYSKVIFRHREKFKTRNRQGHFVEKTQSTKKNLSKFTSMKMRFDSVALNCKNYNKNTKEMLISAFTS